MVIPPRLKYGKCKKCPKLVNAANAQGIPHAGNTNIPASLSTKNAKMVTQIRTSTAKPMQNSIKLNAFKSWVGAPNGGGRRITNSF